MFKTLEELITVIRKRKISSSDDSYTNKLLNDKKLFDFGFNTPSIVAKPGVTSSVTPLLTIVFVSFGSSS